MRKAAGSTFIPGVFTLVLAGLSLAMVHGAPARAADSIDVVELERAARLGSPVLQAARARAQEALALDPGAKLAREVLDRIQ